MMMNNHDDDDARVRFPLPPTVFSPTWAVDMDVYVRFMRQIRASVISKPEQKILVAITSVATQMASELTAPDVALVLVQLGLRAPRGAFPADFVTQALESHIRHMRRGTPFTPPLKDLLVLWGVPVRGVSRGPVETGFSIGSIPRAMQALQKMQNSFGLVPELVL